MLAAVTIDVDALWHTVVIAFAAGLVVILATGSVLFAADRAEAGGTSSAGRVTWLAVAVVSAVVVAAIVVLGLWAMTQKS
jgi:ABC-type Fe3+ transport system permease subunit